MPERGCSSSPRWFPHRRQLGMKKNWTKINISGGGGSSSGSAAPWWLCTFPNSVPSSNSGAYSSLLTESLSECQWWRRLWQLDNVPRTESRTFPIAQHPHSSSRVSRQGLRVQSTSNIPNIVALVLSNLSPGHTMEEKCAIVFGFTWGNGPRLTQSSVACHPVQGSFQIDWLTYFHMIFLARGVRMENKTCNA